MSSKYHEKQWPKVREVAGDDEELRDWILAQTKAVSRDVDIESIQTTAASSDFDTERNGKWWANGTRSTRQLEDPEPNGGLKGGGMAAKFPFHHHHHHQGKAVQFPGQHREMEVHPGSVFLVDSAGKFLKLPIPSDMQEDPLRWGKWKRFGAMLCIVFFSMLGLSAVQLPEVNFQLMQLDPVLEVRHASSGLLAAISC